MPTPVPAKLQCARQYLNFWDNAVAKLYHIRSIPMNFLLNKEGMIVATNLRGDELEMKLHDVLDNQK